MRSGATKSRASYWIRALSTRSQDHQSQLNALGAAHCREIIVETATTRGERPKLTATLERMHSGDTLVIYKPDRIARCMKELLVLLEDQLHARGINLDISDRHPPTQRGHHRRQDAVHSRGHGQWKAASSANEPSTAYEPQKHGWRGGENRIRTGVTGLQTSA